MTRDRRIVVLAAQLRDTTPEERLRLARLYRCGQGYDAADVRHSRQLATELQARGAGRDVRAALESRGHA